MKKGLSNILLVIVALLLGIVVGMLVVRFFITDDEEPIELVQNSIVTESDEKHIEINEYDFINRPESTKDMTIVYENLANDVDSNVFSDYMDVEISNDSVKVTRNDKSDSLNLDGNVVETMHSPMGDGANGYIFFLTDKGSVYYVDVYKDTISIEKIDNLSNVKNLAWVYASKIQRIDPEDSEPFIHNSARNTTLAILEDGKIYDLWEYVMQY